MTFSEIKPNLIENNRFNMKEVIEHYSLGSEEISIATGYIDLKVFGSLRKSLEKFKKIKILIGMEPQLKRSMLNNPYEDFPELDLISDLNEEKFSAEYKEIILFIKKLINDEKLEIKILRNNFLHAKCYIFGSFESTNAVGIVGSSNFTWNGLNENYELNYIEETSQIVQFVPSNQNQQIGHLSWFDKLWNDKNAEEWQYTFLNLIEFSPVGDMLYSPYESYIKTIYEIFNPQLSEELITHDEDENELTGTALFKFQRENTYMLMEKLKNNRVALLADSVGLGKTKTAINVMKQYIYSEKDKIRIEIICPASLTDHWKRELLEEGIIDVTVTSKQNLQSIEDRKKLDSVASVKLFVIDESHNYRSINTQSYEAMEEWIKNNPLSNVLLLTATPINNSLTDIKNQLLLGTGGDPERFHLNYIGADGYSEFLNWSEYIRRVESDMNKDIRETGTFDKDKLKNQMAPIIRNFVVRRTRQGIRDRYGSLSIDGNLQLFPEVHPELLEYKLESHNLSIDELVGLDVDLVDYFSYDPEEIIEKTKKTLLHPFDIVNKNDFNSIDNNNHPMHLIFHLILLLGLVPYKWKMYNNEIYGVERKDLKNIVSTPEEMQQISMQLNFYGIFRTIFLKRMESSTYAFKLSIERYEKILEKFSLGIKKNVFLKTSFIDKYLLEESNSDEPESDSKNEDLISKLLDSKDFEDKDLWEEFNPAEFKTDNLLDDIKKDKLVCELIIQILGNLEKNDIKLKELIANIEQIRNKQPNAKILIFSYFADTLKYIESNIFKLTKLINQDNSAFISSKSSTNKEHVLNRFSPNSRKIKIEENEKEVEFLFSTDIISEGQNLQDSNHIINYDLHWNPVRMIQRNGRINRLGSVFEDVYFYNFKPDSELDNYLNLISRLETKIDIIKNTIGTDAPVLGEEPLPTDYIDLIEKLYSEDKETRKKTVEYLEKEEYDFLTPDEVFINDLISFKEENEIDYQNKIFSIHKNKWHIFKNIHDPSEAFLLAKTFEKDNENNYIVRAFHYKNDSLIEYNTTQFITELRESNYDFKERLQDKLQIDRDDVEDLAFKRLENKLKTKKRKFLPKDRDFFQLIDPMEGDIKLPLEEFNLIVDSLQTTNELNIKKFRKMRDKILKESTSKEEKEKAIEEFIAYAQQAQDQDSQKIVYDKSEIVCKYGKY